MHPKIFEERLEELNSLKSKVQEHKLKKDESIEHIEEWSSKHAAEVQGNEAPIEELQNRIRRLKERENEKRKAEEDQSEEDSLQRRYDEEKPT